MSDLKSSTDEHFPWPQEFWKSSVSLPLLVILLATLFIVGSNLLTLYASLKYAHVYAAETQKSAATLENLLSNAQAFHAWRQGIVRSTVLISAITLLLMGLSFRWLLSPITEILSTAAHILKTRNLKLRAQERGLGQIKHLTRLFNYLLRGLEEMVTLGKERLKTIATFEKYIPPKVVQLALKGQLELGGEERPITILYLDIKHFSDFTNNFGALEVVRMLGEFRRIVDTAIFESKGTIDKHIGDSVLAFWGAPLQQENKELRAIHCLMDVMEKLREWNRIRCSTGLPEIKTWASIASGSAIVGNIGFENRMEYTAIGAVVNKVTRIIRVAHVLQKSILIDEPTREKLPPSFPLEDLGKHYISGLSGETRLFAFLPSAMPPLPGA
jgi:class 3 adenylate cyclase